MTKNRDISKILDQNTTFTATLSVGSGTANLFTNSTIIKLANSTVNTAIVVPTSAQYTGSYFLHANGTWQLAGGLPGGSDTYVQFNDGGASLNGTAGFTFNKGTNNAVIANTLTVGTATINSTNYSQTANNATWHGTSVFANSTGAYPTSNSTGAVIGNTISRVIITGNSATFISTLAAGDTTVTGFVNATTVVNSASHTIGTTLIANTLGVYHTGTMNAASFTTTGFLANTTGVVPTSNSSGQNFGNTLSRWVITGNSATFSSTLAAGDTTITGFVNATVSVNSAAHTIGTTFIANTLGVYHTGIVNAASHTTTGFLANATHVVPTSNSSGQTFGNTISRWVMTANSLTVSGGASPDSNTLGTALGSTTQRWVLLANTIESTGLANVSALNVVNQTNTATLFATTSAAVGANVVANTTAVLVGNSTYFVNHTSQAITLANSTVNTALTIPTSGQYSATNYFLHANGSWVQVTAGGGGAVHIYQAYSATGGQTTFTVSGGYTVNQIDVYENGIHLSNTEYTQDGSTVVLASAALAGEIIEVSGWQSMATFTPVASGSNTNIQFNDSTVLGGSAGFTFDKATNNAVLANTITVGSSTVNAVANSLAFTLANSTVTYSMNKPSAAQVTAANYYLASDSTWKQIAATPPGGSDTYVQYNDAGVLGGLAGFTFTKGTNNVFIANTLTVGSATINSTNYSQTANNALNLGGTAAAGYQTTAGLAANVLVLTSNNATWHGTSVFANSTGAYPTSNSVGAVLGNTISRVIITGNSATFISTLAAGDTTVTGFVNATVSVNSALFTTTGFRANTIGVYPTSNTVGQLLGNTISRWEIDANTFDATGTATIANTLAVTTSVNSALFTTTGFRANTIGVYPASNTVGQLLGNTIARWDITANSIALTGQVANSLGLYPVSNTVGQLLGNTIARWDITYIGGSANSLGLYPISNTAGQLLGNTISRWSLLANTVESTGLANVSALNVVAATNTATLFATTSVAVGANVLANATTITVGNSIVNTMIGNNVVDVGNSSANIVANSTILKAANATSNTLITPANFFTGNSIANLNANSLQLTVANATSNTIVTPASFFTGNSVANMTANLTVIKLSNSTSNTSLTIPSAADWAGSKFLHANGTWATPAGAGGSPGGANTNIQYNDSTAFAGSAGFTFDKTTNNVFFANTLTSGNSTVNAVANSTTLLFSNTSTETISANSAALAIGNSTVNNTLNSVCIAINISPTANLTSNSVIVQLANASGTSNLTPTTLAIATSLLANSLGLYPGSNTVGNLFGNTISRWDAYLDTVDIGAGVIANSIGIYPASNTVGMNFGNTIARWNITANTLVTAGQSANSLGLYPISNTAGQLFGNTISRFAVSAMSVDVAAGNSTVAPVKLVSGTNLTTAAAGAVEFDGTCFYKSAIASTRQVARTEQLITLTSAFTLTSQTGAQKMFNNPTNGAVTVGASTTYFFECHFSLTTLSVTSGTYGFAFGGTAVRTREAWWAISSKVTGAPSLPRATEITYNTAASTTLTTNTTVGNAQSLICGKIVVGTGGTIIPQISQTTAAAAVVGVDSYFRIWPAGLNTVQSVGNWA